MKKNILKKIIIFWISCFAIYWCSFEYIVLPYLHPNGIRAKIKSDYNKTQIPEEVDYLILGDSTALYSINPIHLSEKSYSAAEVGASAARSKQVFLDLNLKKINKGVILIQTFIDAHYNEDIWKIFVPQKMINSSEVLIMFCGSDYLRCPFSQQLYYRLKYFWHRLHVNEYAAEIYAYGIKKHLWQDVTKFIKFSMRAINTNRGHFSARRSPSLGNTEFYNAYYKDFQKPISPPPAERDELIMLAELVGKYQVKFFIVHPQFYPNEPVMQTKLYDVSYKQFMKPLKDLGLTIIENDKMQVPYERRHFRDFSHLNEDGNVLFTKKLLEIMEQI